MTISVSRTIILAPPGSQPWPPPRWPAAEPDDDLDYYLDASAVLADGSDTIVEASLSISPWGAGEMVASDLQVLSGSICSVWLSGGVPGRLYTVRADAMTSGNRTYSWLGQIIIDPTLAASPTPSPPNVNFSSPIIWPSEDPPTVLISQTVTATVTASAYSSGFCAAGLLAFPGAGRAPSNNGFLNNLILTLPDALSLTLDAVIFDAAPTSSTIADHTAIAISNGDLTKICGVIHLSDCTQYSTPTVCQMSSQQPMQFVLQDSQTLYMALVARNAFTPTGTQWSVKIEAEQN